MKLQKYADLFFYTILFLLFFQLMADFVEAIYAFGLLGTGIPPEIVSALLLLSPAALLLLPRGLSGRGLAAVGGAAFFSRAAAVMLDTRGKMLVGGLGVACWLLLFPALLKRRAANGLHTGLGLALGLLLSALLRALNSGTDISSVGPFRLIGWGLAIMAGVWLIRRAGEAPLPDRPARFWRVAALCLGLSGALVLGYFAFSAPNVIARWTGAAYPVVTALMLLSLCAVAGLLAAGRRVSSLLTPKLILGWNALFVLSLTLTIAAHQIRFPAGPAAYPLPEPATTWLHHLPLVLMLLLWPVIVVDFTLFAAELIAAQPSNRVLGGGFSVAGLFLLLMVFAQVFTTTYDYIPVVGPFFRDKFWLVFLTGGAALALPVLLTAPRAVDWSAAAGRAMIPGTALALSVATIGAVLLTAARPVSPPDNPTRLRILTYNIQQGYSEDGLKNFEGQLALIRSVEADVIGLQESDTNRIAGGNSDLVRYLADRLNMYSYYGPKTVPGTFGIALLSKYPLENPRTVYMFSRGEQTAAISAQISAGEKTFNLFVTHLGNGGPLVQQEAVMKAAAGKRNVVLMGDFNFRPDTDQYRLTTASLDDSWLVKWPARQGDKGDRIDHIFVSPGTAVADTYYLDSPASDHPALVADVAW
ncbi:MAG: endonuclease/exonuclease/phosphatase family protein [Anaerolineae bacterium]